MSRLSLETKEKLYSNYLLRSCGINVSGTEVTGIDEKIVVMATIQEAYDSGVCDGNKQSREYFENITNAIFDKIVRLSDDFTKQQLIVILAEIQIEAFITPEKKVSA